MALAFDAVTSYTEAGNSTSHTFSHTCSASANRLLIVSIITSTTANVTGVTYNGVALTQLIEQDDGTGFHPVEMWYLIAPATGANNVVITTSANVAAMDAAACSFTGVDQSVPLGTANSATGTGTNTLTVDIASASGDIVLDAAECQSGSGITLTVDASQTERWNVSDSSTLRGAGSTETASGATTTMSWTQSGTARWAMVGVAVKPVSAIAQAVAGATGALSGSLVKQTNKALAGATGTLSATLDAVRIVLVSLAGSVTATGVASLARVIPILGWRLRRSRNGWKYPRDGR